MIHYLNLERLYQLKKVLRKVLRVKFEVILLSINMLFFAYCIIYHIALNGFDLINVIYEILIYYTLTIILSYSIKDIRKDLIDTLK